MEYIKVEKDIWKMADGSLFEGNVNDVPKGNPSNVAKAGKEYSMEYLEFHGWGKKEKAAPKKKAAKKDKKVENKAVKPEDTEDK
tara:strand:- start:263 stop:514 length:252 start_codon:yes stop_codon:yes gene_type:complete